jgi:hypothetical protein
MDGFSVMRMIGEGDEGNQSESPADPAGLVV